MKANLQGHIHAAASRNGRPDRNIGGSRRGDGNSSQICFLAAIGLVILAVFFLLNRRPDVGRLGELIGWFGASFKRGSAFGITGLLDSAAGTVIAVLIMMSWYGMGDIVERLLDRTLARRGVGDQPPAKELTWARRFAFGAGLCSLLWFALGVADYYRTLSAMVLLIAGMVLFAAALLRTTEAKNSLPEKGTGSKGDNRFYRHAALAFVLFPTVLAFINSLAPPTGKDALIYRLALPKAFVAAGGFIDTPNNIYSFLSLGTEMNGVWALLLGGVFRPQIAETAFGVVAFAYLPLLLTAVYGWGREEGLSKEWSLTAVVLIAAIPTIYQVASTAYVDHALALYVALAIHGVTRWWRSLERIYLAYIAVALGCALSVKLIALFAFLPLFITVLLRARKAQDGLSGQASVHRIMLQGIGTLLIAGCLASPWYIRTWERTGSPVFPFYGHLLKGHAEGWDAERSRLFQIFLSRYGGASKSALDYVLAPVYLSVKAQPESAPLYDGVLGISFMLGLPLLLWGLWKIKVAEEEKIAAFAAAVLYFCWLFTSQQLRFLLPAFPPLALAIAWVSASISSAAPPVKSKGNALQWILLVSAIFGLLVIAAWFLEQNPIRAVLGGESRTEYLERRLDYYPYYEIINRQLPPGARIWLINMRGDTVHLKRPFFTDYVFEDHTIRKFVAEGKDYHDVRRHAQVLGITHVLLRHDVLFDESMSPIVDDRKSAAENQEKMKILKEFLTAGTRVIRSDRKFMLVELPRPDQVQ